MPLSTGSKAPDFTLKSKTADGLKDVSLSANLGQKNTVLLFFPLAFTGVCTQEMCDVSGGLSAYADLGAEGAHLPRCPHRFASTPGSSPPAARLLSCAPSI